jgi:hypothetical protein
MERRRGERHGVVGVHGRRRERERSPRNAHVHPRVERGRAQARIHAWVRRLGAADPPRGDPDQLVARAVPRHQRAAGIALASVVHAVARADHRVGVHDEPLRFVGRRAVRVADDRNVRLEKRRAHRFGLGRPPADDPHQRARGPQRALIRPDERQGCVCGRRPGELEERDVVPEIGVVTGMDLDGGDGVPIAVRRGDTQLAEQDVECVRRKRPVAIVGRTVRCGQEVACPDERATAGEVLIDVQGALGRVLTRTGRISLDDRRRSPEPGRRRRRTEKPGAEQTKKDPSGDADPSF